MIANHFVPKWGNHPSGTVRGAGFDFPLVFDFLSDGFGVPVFGDIRAQPLPYFGFGVGVGVGPFAVDLLADVLALNVTARVVGEDDGADHGGEQDEPGDLEGQCVGGEENVAESDDVVLVLGNGRGGGGGEEAQGRGGDELHRQHADDEQAERQVGGEAFAQFKKVDVDGHEDKQEHHRDGADVDHDEEQAEELGAEKNEHAAGVKKGDQHAEHADHGVARGDDEAGAEQQAEGKEEEEEVGEHGLDSFVNSYAYIFF